MSFALTIHDESMTGERENPFTLGFLTEVVTVRELIRERIYEEVRQFNAGTGDVYRGLVRPTDVEQMLNGPKPERRRTVDWEAQYALALKAFDSNGFFILVDDRQVESLDETVKITPSTQVSFVKLVPLVGG